MKEILLGWRWAIKWIAGKVFWDWEFIPLFGLEPYVLGLSMGRMPHRVTDEEKLTPPTKKGERDDQPPDPH